jgi:hypothetical protein
VHLSSPLTWLFDALEFRRLRRRLPNAHRAWSRATGKLRPESDAEYLVRLRVLTREREQLRSAWQNALAGPATTRSRRHQPGRVPPTSSLHHE